ncbi:class I adenylate-forming enzyme family protein [Bacillus dakarensis]|uniref:class I adenylate-forming enzyme family protein n=1 Tax=Robertmurraya dakarensis TaxID=1926278 RepID=UPI0009820EA2|nr:AMP-binding protein [Bacillus dakarensis]
MNHDNLHLGLSLHTKNRGNDTALVYEGSSLTFSEFNHRVNSLGHSMLSQGIKKGDHVILYMRNRLEMIEIFYAISAIGAVAVPINYMVRGQDLIQLVNSSDSVFAFVEIEKYPDFTEGLAKFTRINESNTVLVGDLPNGLNENFLVYHTFLTSGNQKEIQVPVGSQDLSAFIYSSGTTSLPKGIMLTHGALLTRVLRFAIEWGLSYKDTVLITVPLYHSIGHALMLTLSVLGCKLVVTREFDPEKTIKLMQDEKVTCSIFVPTQYTMMLQVPTIDQYDLSSVRLLISGGAPIIADTKKLIMEKFSCEFSEFFGSTETGAVVVLRPKDVIRKAKSVGLQAEYAEIRLVDNEGKDVAIGEEGEFAVRWGGLFSGYYNLPEETKKSHMEDGWFLLGDIGKMDEEGFYYLLDRKKDMIISGGVNIYPKDIEEVIYTHQAVLETAVIGSPDEKWGENVKAFVVLKQGQKVEKEELMEYCNQKLAKFQRIKEVEFLSTLPRNPSGKILKRELRLIKQDNH